MTATTLPPGSNGLPLVGETLHFMLDRNFLRKRHAAHGSIFRSNILGKPTVFMIGPEAVRFVLASHFDHFSWGEGWPATFQTLLGESLFVQDGEEHRRNRRLLMPAFHGKALVGYFNAMDTIMRRYLERWLDQGEFDWFTENKQLTFDIAAQTMLGVPSGPAVARLSSLFTTLTNGFFVLGRSRLPWTKFGKALAARDELLAFIEGVIEERRATPTNDALSMLLEARDEDGNGLSQREITVQCMLLLFAGHETSTSMLTTLALELARNPEVLARARAEQAALAARGPLSLEQLGQMPYLEQVLREVERLHPPVPGGFRGVVKPFEYGGYVVPSGYRVQYSILGTHHTPAVYQDSERFDPDRFAPGREEHKTQPFSLIAFGGGPRICLGMAFAQMEMKLLAAHLLREYRWDLLPGQDLDLSLIPTRRPKDNLRVFFRRWHEQKAKG
jgi:cytochrome P450